MNTNTSTRIWVIDASMSHDAHEGVICFCPLEEGAVITGLNFVSDKPPHGEQCVGVWHPEGQDKAEQWASEYSDQIKHLWEKRV